MLIKHHFPNTNLVYQNAIHIHTHLTQSALVNQTLSNFQYYDLISKHLRTTSFAKCLPLVGMMPNEKYFAKSNSDDGDLRIVYDRRTSSEYAVGGVGAVKWQQFISVMVERPAIPITDFAQTCEEWGCVQKIFAICVNECIKSR